MLDSTTAEQIYNSEKYQIMNSGIRYFFMWTEKYENYPNNRNYIVVSIYVLSIYIYIYIHHTTCESKCDTLTSSAANQGDNTVMKYEN